MLEADRGTVEKQSPGNISVYLFADTSASINTHHPEAQRLGELLTLLGDL